MVSNWGERLIPKTPATAPEPQKHSGPYVAGAGRSERPLLSQARTYAVWQPGPAAARESAPPVASVCGPSQKGLPLPPPGSLLGSPVSLSHCAVNPAIPTDGLPTSNFRD